MSNRLIASFTPSFKRDLKRIVKKHWNTDLLAQVIELIIENSSSSLRVLHQRHNMHRLSGEWVNSYECHVANIGDWLLVWRVDSGVAYMQRTGTHDDIFR